ncbi:MAG: type II secretion system protein [Planctomycetes bacterium]|nr:type II secretion system protein [Planctomycetota bacterium]
MADGPDSGRRPDAGFTLAEMLAALGILLFGVTALIGALSSSVAQRRTTDARLEATALCELALHRLQYEAVRRAASAATDLDLEFAPLQDQSATGFPGMTWSAAAITDPDRPDVWLVRLEVRWLESGESVAEVFHRVLPRQLPLGTRVLRFRDEMPATSVR